jgi:FkbM family methyltransferase
MIAPKPPSKNSRNLATLLAHHRIDLVLDVGANTGQYAQRLRRVGYRGRIVSFEPQTSAHAVLTEAAAGDPGWQVAPRMALGDSDRPLTLNLSAQSDMSSALAMTGEMTELLDSAAYTGTETARQARLDAIFVEFARPGDRVLLKSDTQGYDRQVLDGASGVLDRILAVQLELAIVPVYVGEPSYREMIDRLEEIGFSPSLFIPGYFNRRTARLIGMDGVFVRHGA